MVIDPTWTKPVLLQSVIGIHAIRAISNFNYVQLPAKVKRLLCVKAILRDMPDAMFHARKYCCQLTLTAAPGAI